MWIIPKDSPSGIPIKTNHRESNQKKMVTKKTFKSKLFRI
jgi:hypothetical protein